MGMPLARHRFTVDQYHRMGEAGVFHEDDRVELIDGQIVEMTPIGAPHAACVDRLTRAFSRRVGDLAIVRVQSPVVLGPRAEPQPDLALLRPPIERYARAHPEPADVLLVVEVADTSPEYDRSVKIPLYARAGIPEAWLVDLVAERIEVHRNPRDGAYTDRQVVARGATLTVLHLPHVSLRAEEVLG